MLIFAKQSWIVSFTGWASSASLCTFLPTTLFDSFAEKVVDDLSDVARWLNDKGDSQKFVEIYYVTRATVMKKSIEELKDHLAKKSGGSGSAFVSKSVEIYPICW